jgi:hypothetical protein
VLGGGEGGGRGGRRWERRGARLIFKRVRVAAKYPRFKLGKSVPIGRQGTIQWYLPTPPAGYIQQANNLLAIRKRQAYSD